MNNEEFNVLIKGEDIVQLLKGIIRLKYNTITVFLKKIKIILKNGKGIVHYMSGFGALRDYIEINIA